MAIQIAQDSKADQVLTQDSFALLVGMLLDQQFPMERAFAGPAKILERFGTLDPAAIAAADPEAFADLCSRPPAIHRFPASMAARVQAVAGAIVQTYGGQVEQLWEGAGTGQELLKRVSSLPGFGRQKSQIFVALLGKQLGVQPPGWREAAGGYGEPGVFKSVADVIDPDSLAKVRAYKKEHKARAG
jgi:uncharacterized HhH-GPD family protein